MTPLETVVRIVGAHGTPELAQRVRALAAQEEAAPDGFWEDLADPSLWQGEGSLAELAASGIPEAERLTRQLALISEDLRLRGLESDASDAWLERHRAQRRSRPA